MSARWPTVSRPRSGSPAETAGSTHAARSARSRVSASSGPNAGVPAGQRGSSRRDGQRDARPRVERLDRRVRPERHDGAGARERAPTCSRAPRRGRPTAAAPCRRPIPRWTGWTLAAIPARGEPAAGRPGASIWTCSMRGISGDRPRGIGVEHVERGPDGRVADGVDLRRDAAGRRARRARSASSAGSRHPDAAALVRRQRPVRPRARCRLEQAPRSATPSSRRRSSFCQPTRARPAGSAPRTSPLRRPPARAVSSASSRRHAWTRIGRRPRIGEVRVGRERVREVRVRARAAPGSWHGHDAERDAARWPTVAIARSRGRHRPASGMWTVTRRVGGLEQDALRRRRRRSRRMMPPGGSAVVGGHAGRPQRRVAGQQGVVVVGPEGDPAAGRDAPRGRRRSASRPTGRSPSRGPRSRRRGRPSAPRWAAPDRAARPSSSVALAVRSTCRRARARPARDGGGRRSARGSPPRRARGRSARCAGRPASRDRPRTRRTRRARRGSRWPRPSRSPASPASVAIRPVISASSGTRRQSRSVGSAGPACIERRRSSGVGGLAA